MCMGEWLQQKRSSRLAFYYLREKYVIGCNVKDCSCSSDKILTSAGCSDHPGRIDGDKKVNGDGGAAS